MDRDDPDRHPWVVPEPERYERMTQDALGRVLDDLRDRNNTGWARAQQHLGKRRRKATS